MDRESIYCDTDEGAADINDTNAEIQADPSQEGGHISPQLSHRTISVTEGFVQLMGSHLLRGSNHLKGSHHLRGSNLLRGSSIDHKKFQVLSSFISRPQRLMSFLH